MEHKVDTYIWVFDWLYIYGPLFEYLFIVILLVYIFDLDCTYNCSFFLNYWYLNIHTIMTGKFPTIMNYIARDYIFFLVFKLRNIFIIWASSTSLPR
jgi:hypothetical protein